MSTVQEIETAIKRLPKTEVWQLVQWLNDYVDDDWDREMKRDARPGGKLDRLVKKVKADVKAGKVSEIRC